MLFRLRWQWALILLIFALFAGVHGLRSWQIGTDYPWLRLGSDQTYIGTIYYGLYTPEFYARDWLLSQTQYYQFYTPSFLRLLNLLESLAGDVPRAFAVLHAPLLLIYLLTAAALFWYVTRSEMLAAIFALVSAHGIESTISAWTPTLFIRVLPLSLVLFVVLLALLALIWTLDKARQRQARSRYWVLTGALIGIAANLHPGTGIGLALFTGFLLVAYWYRTGTPFLYHVVIMTVTTLVFAAPIVLNVLPNIGKVVTNPVASDFETFARIFSTRGFVMPRQFTDVFRWPLAQFSEQTQILIGLGWLPITLILGWRMRVNQRDGWVVLFVSIQLVYAWLLINPGTHVILYFVVLLFFGWRWYMRDERQEMLYFGMLAAIPGVALFLTMVGWLAWSNFQIWGLTNFVGELPRSATLFTPVFCLIGARAAWHGYQAAQKSTPLLGVLWLLALMLLAGILDPFNIWFGLLLLALLFTGILHEYSPPGLRLAVWVLIVPLALRTLINATWMQIFEVTLPTTIVMVMGVVGGSLFWLIYERWQSPSVFRALLTIGLSLILAVAAFLLVYPLTVNAGFTPDFMVEKILMQAAEIRLPVVALGCSVLLFFMLVLRPLAGVANARWLIVSAGIVLFSIVWHIPFDEYTNPPSEAERTPPPLVQMALWAQANTPPDALFYCATNPSLSERCYTFRFWAQRSITYDGRSLRIVEYSRPAEMAYWMATIDSAVNAAQRETTLLENARGLDVNYIILEATAASVPLSLPLVYENDMYRVYEYNQADS
jgi:hypothetical protein